jgi:hypothetical protein
MTAMTAMMTMTAVTAMMTMTAMTAMTAMMTMTAVTAMTMTTMTAMTTVAMTGERGHGKQHGSRYRANKREFPKHEFLHGQPAILSPTTTLLARACSNDDPWRRAPSLVISANETIRTTMDGRADSRRL